MSELLDTVAEAIWRAGVGADLDELYPWDSRDDETTKAHYRRMAQAAIDALGLYEETERIWDDKPARTEQFWRTKGEVIYDPNFD